MITSIRNLIKKHPLIFGVLVFFGSVVSGMFTILLASSFFWDVTCKEVRDPSSWAGMNDLFFFITTSPLLLLWSGVQHLLRKEMQAIQHSALDGRNPFSIRLLVL